MSSSVLVSEAISFLNGAHLNPRGQLSKLFRRYYQTRTASPPNTGAVSVEASPSLSSLVLSELGVNHLNKEQLSQALANCWTSLDSHSVNSGTITVCDVLKQCRGTYWYMYCVSCAIYSIAGNFGEVFDLANL